MIWPQTTTLHARRGDCCRFVTVPLNLAACVRGAAGYNQAEMIARLAAGHLGYPFSVVSLSAHTASARTKIRLLPHRGARLGEDRLTVALMAMHCTKSSVNQTLCVLLDEEHDCKFTTGGGTLDALLPDLSTGAGPPVSGTVSLAVCLSVSSPTAQETPVPPPPPVTTQRSADSQFFSYYNSCSGAFSLTGAWETRPADGSGPQKNENKFLPRWWIPGRPKNSCRKVRGEEKKRLRAIRFLGGRQASHSLQDPVLGLNANVFEPP